MTVVGNTFYTRLPGSTKRLQCVGAQTTAGGLYDCMYPYPYQSGSFLDTSPLQYEQFGSYAVLTYNGVTITVSFSLSGSTKYNASMAMCSTFPQLLRSFSSTSVTRNSNFTNNTRLAVNASGMVFLADVNRNCIFTVDPITGWVALFAGQCDTAGYQDGAALSALFNKITGIEFDAAGLMYVLDAGNSRVRVVARDGSVTSISGNGNSASVDGTGSSVSYLDLAGVALHPTSGRLYISEAYRIRILNQQTNTVKTLAGSTSSGYAVGSGTKALLNRPGKLAFTADGNVFYFVDSGNSCLRKVSATGSVVTLTCALVPTVVGSFLYRGVVPVSGPQSAILDATSGNIFVTDNGKVWIYVIASGTITTFGGASTLVTTPNATDFAVSRTTGTLYVADGSQVHALYR